MLIVLNVFGFPVSDISSTLLLWDCGITGTWIFPSSLVFWSVRVWLLSEDIFCVISTLFKFWFSVVLSAFAKVGVTINRPRTIAA